MNVLFAYPKAAQFGRVLPKSKIYDQAKPGPKLRQLFVDQVGQISWQYKLAPETINLPATVAVPEIQVFRLVLKQGTIHDDVLRCIDQAIPYPLLFELQDDEQLKVMAAYKRPSEADSGKWVVSDYFASDWMSVDTGRRALPVVLDMAALYERLLAPLLPYAAQPGETLVAYIERLEQICAKQRALAQCQSRLLKEKQFNRKVAINAEVRVLNQASSELIG